MANHKQLNPDKRTSSRPSGASSNVAMYGGDLDQYISERIEAAATEFFEIEAFEVNEIVNDVYGGVRGIFLEEKNQFCLITREATEKISAIHHREPLIINQSQINNYLNVKKDAMEILNSIKPPELKFHEISKDINNPVNNDPALIKPLN